MQVTIYIDIYHTGHLKRGTGSYSIVLEYILSSGAPKTKEIIEGYKGTSKNRTALYACITALKQLLKPCELEIRINSEYIAQSVKYLEQWISSGKNAKGHPAKNMDLWQQLSGLMEQHTVNFVYAGSSSYTAAMKNLLMHTKIELKEDLNNV